MFHRIVFYFMTLLSIIILAPVRNVFAQKCIGSTAYIVRDETGKVMNLQEMRKLVIKVDGVMIDPKHFNPSTPSVLLSDQNEYRGTNPMVFWAGYLRDSTNASVGACGKIGVFEISSGRKQMRLFFDIAEHNTSYLIDSLPFQEGTFHLRCLKCKDGARPPMIDNNTTGECVVSAENWEGMDKDWVRHLVPSKYPYGGGNINKPAEFCRKKHIDVITTQSDWVAIWKLYPEATLGNTIQAVDFRTEVVLAVYLAGRSASYSLHSITVDKRGNLTFDPGSGGYDRPTACSILFLIIRRSGIKSIEGTPLPPVPE